MLQKKTKLEYAITIGQNTESLGFTFKAVGDSLVEAANNGRDVAIHWGDGTLYIKIDLEK
jgi:hypothetical protein